MICSVDEPKELVNQINHQEEKMNNVGNQSTCARANINRRFYLK